MIYFDNSATTLMKPRGVSEAVAHAVGSFGNAGRSFHGPVLAANREIYNTRMEIAKLIGIDDPLNVAFTSSATESLNLVIGGLVGRGDSVVTTVAEHNSVLRPLYLTGCGICFMGCDDSGSLLADAFGGLLRPPAKFLICTHGSNLTGNVTDARKLHSICKENGVTMVLDISQTFGAVPVTADMSDIFCFTGHKALFGPQGTGGVVVNGEFDFDAVKAGGAGANSFQKHQSKNMPDVFEAGTMNSHGIYGLQKGVRFINETGIDVIREKEERLLYMFYDGIKDMPRMTVYGDFSDRGRLPIVSANMEGLSSADFAHRLWNDYGIATRAGSHCAPLLHERFGTAGRGMVRFSFSYFNTEDEIEKGIEAIGEIAGG